MTAALLVPTPTVCPRCNGEGWVRHVFGLTADRTRVTAERPCPDCRCVCGAEPVNGAKSRLCEWCESAMFLDADDRERRRADR